MEPNDGNPEVNKIHTAALDVARKIKNEAGTKVMNDVTRTLYWEEAYRNIVQADGELTGTPLVHSGTPSKPPSHEVGSGINSTSSCDEHPQASARVNAIVEREAMDDAVPAEKKAKDKGVVRPVKGNSSSGNVVAETYRHRDGEAIGKAIATERVLGTPADRLSLETQDERDGTQMEFLRKSPNPDRRGWMSGEREKELNKTIKELERDNIVLRERAVSAETKLSFIGYQTPAIPIPPVYSASVHFPISSTFATDSQLYEVPNIASNNFEVENVAGPGPRAMGYHQHGFRIDGDSVFEGERIMTGEHTPNSRG